ncbi:MAG: acyltransferase family protein [Proteobacteria bacterium]|nr:acyltransferase family protein [Pseudomonadota bacterium]
MPRHHALDALKLLLAVLVTLFHAQALAAISPELALLADKGFGRIVVPVFLLINGYFFQPQLARGAHRAWLTWVAALYGLCMVLYLPFWLGGLPAGPMGAAVFVGRWLLGFAHLWYLAGLLLAALLLVALRRWPARRLVALASGLWLAGVVLQYAAAYQWAGEASLAARMLTSVHSYRNGLLLSFPYFCMGYLLRAHRVPERLPGGVVAALFGLALVGLLGEAMINVRLTPAATQIDNPLFALVAAPVVFLAALRLPMQAPALPLSALAIGIYLLHPLALWLLHLWPPLDALTEGLGAIVISAMLTQALMAARDGWLAQRAGAYRSDSIKSM